MGGCSRTEAVLVVSPPPPPLSDHLSSSSPDTRGVSTTLSPLIMHHRPPPTVRNSSSLTPSAVSSRAPTPRHSPLLPSASPAISNSYPLDKYDVLQTQQQLQQLQQLQQQQQPTICGMPLKYVSLVTLAVQNAALSIVMHYSRVSIPPSLAYSPASAVLLNEVLKGSISFIIALLRSPLLQQPLHQHPLTRRKPFSAPLLWFSAFTHLCREIFSPDCWKLSIPAILYVVQNSLQFVAIANLPVASFQVTYQMKILTTAAFSVALLRKKLTPAKWLSLFFLAIGVGIVQIQNAATSKPPSAVGSAHEFHHVMNPLKGFGAVTAACFTSGLAGVYFEMVLKGSKADLWVRNVQLSLFSLIPALLPAVYAARPPNSQGFVHDLFRHFGWWAWATVAIQVFGGLVTAVVIKYSDNILKGFATSLSIVFSFLASVALFDFRITPSFVIGAGTVLSATWMYNQPSAPSSASSAGPALSASSSVDSSPVLGKEKATFSIVLNDASPASSGKSSPTSSPYYPGTPISLGGGMGPANGDPAGSGVLGGLGVGSFMRRKSGGFGGAGSSRNSSTASLTALLSASIGSAASASSAGTGGVPGTTTPVGGGGKGELGLAESGEIVHAYGAADEMGYYGTPFSSRPPSRMGSRPPSPPRFGRPAS